MKDTGSESIHAVIDASVILAFISPDESLDGLIAATIREGLKRKRLLAAPHVLKFEVPNGIRSMVLRKRATLKQAEAIIRKFSELSVCYYDVDMEAAFPYALMHQLSYYDASYVILANTLSVPLLTLDTRLQRLTDTR